MFRFNTKRPFVDITPQTPLSSLGKFFEKNASAVVTEKSNDTSFVMVTKLIQFQMGA
jgi:hypothetical protein